MLLLFLNDSTCFSVYLCAILKCFRGVTGVRGMSRVLLPNDDDNVYLDKIHLQQQSKNFFHI
jgi:hypothetical protein